MIFFYKYLIAIIFFFILSGVSVNLSMKEYLEFKVKEAKGIILKTYLEARASIAGNVESNIYAEKWIYIWSEICGEYYPRLIKDFNEIFIVANEKIISIDLNSENYETRIVSDLNLPFSRGSIKFIKSFIWNESLFLLVCRMDSCSHYQGTGISKLKKWQLIEYDDLIPKDATFFTRGKNLYLIISHDRINYSTNITSPSKIYQWTGANMNLIEEILIRSTIAVAAIRANLSTIVLFAHEYNETKEQTPKIGCSLYKLEDKSKAKSISFLNFISPIKYFFPYQYNGEEFILLVGDQNSSGVFCWDGNFLIKCISMTEINSASLVDLIHIKNDTLLFVYNPGAIFMYRIEGHSYTHLKKLNLEYKEKAIEIAALEKNNSIILFIVKQNLNNTYYLDLWQLYMQEEYDRLESKEVWTCFNELQDLITLRESVIKDLKNTDLKSLFILENDTAEIPIEKPQIINIDEEDESPLFEIDTDDELEVFSDFEILNELKNVEKQIDKVSARIEKMYPKNGVMNLTGDVVIEGNAEFEEVYIDKVNVEFLNDEKLETDKFIFNGIDQNFTEPLQARSIYIENLEVPSLCNIKPENWLRVNDTERTKLNDIDLTNATIKNDTIIIHSGLTIKHLCAENIDDINIKKFLSEVFLVGENQVIRGNIIYKNPIRVEHVMANRVNNHLSNELVTRFTEQNLTDFYIETLSVKHLYVETINGVRVEEAARMSQENVIKGKVKISKLIIKDELIITENATFPSCLTPIYDNVTIHGDVFVTNLEIAPGATLMIGDDIKKSINIHDLLENSWSRSRNQTITNSITLEKGAVIDELEVEYLNGHAEHDFLYVTDEEISGVTNITFTDFEFNRVINNDTGKMKTIVEETADSFIFHETIRMSQLTVEDVFTKNYSGIPVEFIMKPNGTFKFSGITEFEEMNVDELITDHIQTDYINSRSTDILKNVLWVDQDLEIDVLETDEFHAKSMNIKYLNNHDLEEALLAHENIIRQPNISITIEGDLEITDNLQVEKINNLDPDDYIEMLKNEDPVNIFNTENIKDLYITNDLTVDTVNGHKLHDVFAKKLSKSKKQVLEEVICSEARVKYLKTEIINKQKVSDLLFAGEPITIYGNVTFSELYVLGNIRTKTLNGKTVMQAYKDMHTIPVKGPINLTITGDISWDIPLSNEYSISNLLKYAVTKDTDQTIEAPVTFLGKVTIDSMYVPKNSSLLKRIRRIVDDTVTDNPNNGPIIITAPKIFKKNLTVGNLEVTGNIDINDVNGYNFAKFSSEIYQKYSNDTVNGEITFLGKVKINKLITNCTIHGVSLHNIVTYDSKMPDKLHFKHLRVKDVTLETLDGVDFDDFLRRRVTTNGHHVIPGDVKFIGNITVLNGTFVSLINGIDPNDFVVNTNSTEPTIIYGQKTFLSELTVEGDVETIKINNIDVQKMYNASLSINDTYNIYGDLIFEHDVEFRGNINITGEINGMKIPDILETLSQYPKLIEQLSEDELYIKNVISDFKNLSSKFISEVLYVDEDEQLRMHLPKTINARGSEVKSLMRLDIHAIEPSAFCRLTDNCTCRRQYTVHISAFRNFTIYQEPSSNVTFNFYDPSRLSGLSIVTNAVSTSDRCSKKTYEDEVSSIFWMTFDDNAELVLKQLALEVEGFLADAQRFVIDDKLYLILAIFYDKSMKTHATDCLIYEFNLKNRSVEFVQAIPTEGAKTVHIFHINNIVHALIGCVKGKTKTLLLRFNLVTRKFHLHQTFATGGSKHITSISRKNTSFIILSNPKMEALQIFIYDSTSDNFTEYQNLDFDARVTSLGVFYARDYGVSEAFIVATTKDERFYMFEYMFAGKFKIKISHRMEDIRLISPFRFKKENYLFVGLRFNSTILKVIQSG